MLCSTLCEVECSLSCVGRVWWGVVYLYGLKNQYAPNFPSECPKPGVCIFALKLFGNKKTYFSQMFLKIHPRGPSQANGSLQVCKKRSLLGVVLLTLLRTWRVKDVRTEYGISREIKHQNVFRKVLLDTEMYV